MQGFETIQAELARGRKGTRRLGNHTYLHPIPGGIAMKYHNTDVAIFRPDYVELNSGGWLTYTTKERLNWALNLAKIPASVWQSKSVWYCGRSEFFNGITIRYNGKVIDPRPATKPMDLRQAKKKGLLDVNDSRLVGQLKDHDLQAQAITRKLIKRYIATLSKAIDNGTLDLSLDGGSCWFCSMVTKDAQTIGEVMGDVGHLVAHLKEQYLMLGLILNALKYRGYKYPGMFVLNSDMKTDIKTIQDHKWHITNAVHRYFKDKLVDRLVTA